MPELVGALVGDYFLLDCLAREGITETYRARPTMRGGYDVILRLFRPSFHDPEGFREHFAAEVEKVWRCHHAAIQPLLEFGTGGDLLFCVARIGDEETLERTLKRQPETLLPVEAVVEIVVQLCLAVQYAHDQRIVHGNIQPSSILIGADGRVLLANFAMRRAYCEGEALVSQIHEGNAAYCAPEQSLGMISQASDIYALGVLLYRLLCGVLPYDGESAEEIALRHADEPLPSLRALRPAVPAALELVVHVALAKSPQQRFASPSALAQALREAMAGNHSPVVPEPAERRIPVRSRRTQSGWQRAASLCTIAVLLFGLIWTSFFIFSLPQSFAPFRNARAWPFFPPSSPTTDKARQKPVVTSTPAANQTPLISLPGKSPPVLTTMMPTTKPSPFSCINGTLSIDGSANLQPLLQQIANDYQRECPGFTITVRDDGSRTAFGLLQQGAIDVVASDVAASAAYNFTDHPFGAMLYAVIANPDTSVNGLSTAQLQAIYRGKITNWAQVGGPDMSISVIQHTAADPVASIFRSFVLHGMTEHVHGVKLKSNWAQAVAQTAGAISYVPLQDVQGTNVDVLAIDGVLPGSASVIAGSYPFWSVEHLYTQGAGAAQFQAYLSSLSSAQETSLFSRYAIVPLALLPQSIRASHQLGPQITSSHQ